MSFRAITLFPEPAGRLRFEFDGVPLSLTALASERLRNQAATEPGMSHWSHGGGILCGIIPSFVYLPNFNKEAWEEWLPIIAAVLTIVIFTAFPLGIYFEKFPDMSCHQSDVGLAAAQS